jgi:hypothetical protein
MKTAIDVRRWRNGWWSVTAHDAARERYTLVQGRRGRSARVVMVDAHRCVEATAQTARFAHGLGWAVIDARIDRHGWSGRMRRVFPDGTVRIDDVRRGGRGGEAHAQWMFANGSRADQTATPGHLVTRLYDRAGRQVRADSATLTRNRTDRVAAYVTITDGAGNVVGHASTTRAKTADGERASSVTERSSEVVSAESSSDVTSDGRKIGREVTRGNDGSRTVTEWTHYDDGSHEQTEVTTSGDTTTTTTSVTTPNADGSTSTHTETTIEGADGSTTRTVSDSRADADGVTTDSTTTRDGVTVGRSASGTDAEGNTSTASVYYNDDGSGVVVVTSRDKDGNSSTSADEFDNQGNPTGSSSGSSGPSGGSAPSGGSGGGEPQGGGDAPSGGSSSGGGDPPSGGNPGGGDDDQGGGAPPEPSGGGGGERPAEDGSGGGSDDGPHLGGRFGPYMLKGLESVASDDEGDGEGGSDGEGPEFSGMHGSLVHDVGGGGPPIDPEGGGWGSDDGPEGTDGTGAPSFHVSADASVLAGLGHRANTEDWGDFNDPRVLVAVTASMLNIGNEAALTRALDAASR